MDPHASNPHRWGRRRFLRDGLGLGAAAGLSPWLPGCTCECLPPIAWAPTVLTPVFYGHRDLTLPTSGRAVRVFFPSIDGSPSSAAMLTCLGDYPLVLFLHGQCDDASVQDHLRWFRLPAALARSGFVVAVPDLPWGGGHYPWSAPSTEYDIAVETLDFMYQDWDDREWLTVRTQVLLAGHSYGGMLAGRLAADIPNAGLLCLGAGWAEWPGSPALPLPSLNGPSAFMVGTADIFADQASLLSQAPAPSHQVRFDGGTHWDHLDANNDLCGDTHGPCDLVDELSADLGVLYLSRLTREPSIPASLEPPAVTLVGDQPFYAGAHLTSLSMLPQAGCTVTVEWRLPATGSDTLPW